MRTLHLVAQGLRGVNPLNSVYTSITWNLLSPHPRILVDPEYHPDLLTWTGEQAVTVSPDQPRYPICMGDPISYTKVEYPMETTEGLSE